MTLSSEIDTLIKNTQGRTTRDSNESVLEELGSLGISPKTQFGSFFSVYVANNLNSPVSSDELLDLCSPTPQIRDTTVWLRDLDADFYKDFITLTSFESEAGYLYNIKTGEVVDHSWPDVIDKTWDSFNEFIYWYLTGNKGTE